jgi:hypothetical protein
LVAGRLAFYFNGGNIYHTPSGDPSASPCQILLIDLSLSPFLERGMGGEVY